ncbi:hypothetical protein HDV03_000958 [Kappamyces sp. JEL0829]|nr:hypothetical protein HDV03_000958 [Kappamyces sp. JEL0829]
MALLPQLAVLGRRQSVRVSVRWLTEKAAETKTAADAERLVIGFTCKVCSTRSYKSMSKQAYNNGVVIIKCDGCKNLHLIADHLGWFDSQKGPVGTIESIMKEKGESVQRVQFDPSMAKIASSAGSSQGSPQLSQEKDDMLEWLPSVIEKLEKK